MKTILLCGGRDILRSPAALETTASLLKQILADVGTAYILADKSFTAFVSNVIRRNLLTAELIRPMFGEKKARTHWARFSAAEYVREVDEVHSVLSLFGDHKDAVALYGAFFGKVRGLPVFVYLVFENNYVVIS